MNSHHSTFQSADSDAQALYVIDRMDGWHPPSKRYSLAIVIDGDFQNRAYREKDQSFYYIAALKVTAGLTGLSD